MVYFKEQVLHCDLQLLLSCLYIVNPVICLQGIHTHLWVYNRKTVYSETVARKLNL